MTGLMQRAGGIGQLVVLLALATTCAWENHYILPCESSCTTRWIPVADLQIPRAWHTATLLNNGTVLVVGGYNEALALTPTEIYDPATNAWRYAAGASDPATNG